MSQESANSVAGLSEMNVGLVVEETGTGSQSEYKSSLRASSYDRHVESLNSCGRSREPRSCAPSRDSISGIQAWQVSSKHHWESMSLKVR